MSIQNRDEGLSQQLEILPLVLNAAVVTGASLVGRAVPFACSLQGVFAGALGLSGSPQYMFNVLRFTSGGATTLALGISNITLSAALGTSAMIGWSGIRAAGSTILNLAKGDVVLVTSAGANTAVEKLVVDLIVKKTDDIVQYYSLPT